MTNSEILNLFVSLVNFLGEAMGKNAEVVLHDVSHPEHSVIAISHGYHSGRNIGSSLTDFAFNIKTNREYVGQDYLVNYRATSRGKDFIASTYYIKNQGKLIGMLCINVDTSTTKNFYESTRQFIESFNLGPVISAGKETDVIEENLDLSIASYANSIIAKTISESNILPERMTRDEKMQIVWELAEQGIPRMKGAIVEIARQLDISESTVYRYISQREKNS
ncbi:putative transcriptional regulator YheO [Muricomes intestini]|uniref:Putative transcriptional regulator YheO n=1 Tax=Muricomes intestini TaxID=1796634 RepID=A0A4R3JX42_9FIRM|nr:PAS domain-containing protein [Muricomes intestini]TCS72875.1 putative transcriptional regulator YheO [Muricomes intestini]